MNNDFAKILYFKWSSVTCALVLLLVMSFLLAGCGEDHAQLPPNASIQATPASKEWQIVANDQMNEDGTTTCVILDDYYQDELVSVTVTDSVGRPIEDAELIFSLNLAGNTYSGQPVLSLYNDLNKNYVADAGELVSSRSDDLFITQTEAYTGSKRVIVRMNLSCPYMGELRIFSGGLSTSVDFNVVSQ